MAFSTSGIQAHWYTDFTDRTDFFRFHGEFRVVRVIRVQQLVLSSDNEKTTESTYFKRTEICILRFLEINRAFQILYQLKILREVQIQPK